MPSFKIPGIKSWFDPYGSISIGKERKTKKEILASYRILKHAFDKVIDFHILEEILKRARNDKPLC